MIAFVLFATVTASASVRATKVEAGDPVAIEVRVSARPGAFVTIKPPESRLPDFEIDGTPHVAQADAAGGAVWRFDVTPYADHEISIPPFVIDVPGGGNVATNPVTLRPFNPLGAAAKSASPKDIRDIRAFPVRWPLWLLGLGGVALAALLFAFFRPRSEAEPPAKIIPLSPPPRIRTLADMIDDVRRVSEHPPRDREGIREAHFIVAEAVRRYVEERWEVPASRQTTEEFLEAVAARNVPRLRGDDPTRAGLGGPRLGMGMEMLPAVLEACDRVKWAGDAVGPDDTVQLARTALEFFAASRSAIRGLGGAEAGATPPGEEPR